jgi:hypothetical protein
MTSAIVQCCPLSSRKHNNDRIKERIPYVVVTAEVVHVVIRLEDFVLTQHPSNLERHVGLQMAAITPP